MPRPPLPSASPRRLSSTLRSFRLSPRAAGLSFRVPTPRVGAARTLTPGTFQNPRAGRVGQRAAGRHLVPTAILALAPREPARRPGPAAPRCPPQRRLHPRANSVGQLSCQRPAGLTSAAPPAGGLSARPQEGAFRLTVLPETPRQGTKVARQPANRPVGEDGRCPQNGTDGRKASSPRKQR